MNSVQEIKEKENLNDKYKVIEKISSGSKADVYKVQDIRNDNTFAIRVERETSQFDRNKDIPIQATLEDNYILPILDYGEISIDNKKYIGEVFPFVQIQVSENKFVNNFAQYLDEKKSNVNKHKVLNAMEHIFNTILLIHKKGYVHNNISLENILLSEIENNNFYPRLTDFTAAIKHNIRIDLQQRDLKDFVAALERVLNSFELDQNHPSLVSIIQLHQKKCVKVDDIFELFIALKKTFENN